MEHIGLYLKDIFFNKKRGRLIFLHGNIQKYLFFHDGYLVFAKTNQQEELLGEVLFRLGKLSEEAFSTIEDHIEPRKRIGEILVEKGLISHEDLREGISYQMREIVLNIFPDFNGEFKYQEKTDFVDQEFETRITVSDLIEDGIRRMKFDPALKKFMGKKTPFSKEKSFYYRITEEEKEIFETITGNSSAEALLSSSSFNPELFWKSLYLFFCLDLIDVKEEGSGLHGLKVDKKTAIGEEEKNIADALELSENFSKMNYYQILDVSPSASQSEMKKSYFQLARKYHPDLFPRDLPYEIKGIVEKVFDQITKAYQNLSDDAKREEYDSRIDTRVPDEKKDMGKMAEVKFRQGKTLYNQGKYDEAQILLEEAVRLDSSKARYFLLLGLVESKIPSSCRQGEQSFLKSIKLEPWNPEGYVGLGLLYKKEGLHAKAKRQFEKALKVDPDHKAALRELRLGGKAGQKKGLKDFLPFDLFKKK